MNDRSRPGGAASSLSDDMIIAPGSTSSLVPARKSGSAVYQAGRIRATKAELELRRTTLVDLAREAQPASVRHIYYRAVVAGLVDKSESGYNKVQRDLLELRKNGTIPFDWITDPGRRAHWPLTDSSPESALRYLARTYRRDPWDRYDPETPRVEIWCESLSIAGVLHPLVERYAVPIFPLKGQGSETFVQEAAQEYRRWPAKQIVVLFASDWDPAGREIASQCEGKLRRYSDHPNLTFRQLAVDGEQARVLSAAGLGTTPKKTTWKAFDGTQHQFAGQAVESEAIEADTMRRLFADAIEQIAAGHYGHDIFADNTRIEVLEREQLLELARAWSA